MEKRTLNNAQNDATKVILEGMLKEMDVSQEQINSIKDSDKLLPALTAFLSYKRRLEKESETNKEIHIL